MMIVRENRFLKCFSASLVVFLTAVLLSGCKTVQPAQGQKETPTEVQEALSAVAQAVSGKTLDEKDLKALEKQIRDDKQAQSAIEAITGSVGGKAPIVKYCPITGKRYSADMEMCPEHKVPLKVVEP
jgi:hypothetical protein